MNNTILNRMKKIRYKQCMDIVNKMRTKTSRKTVLVDTNYYKLLSNEDFIQKIPRKIDVRNPFNIFYFNTLAGIMIQLNNLHNIPEISQDLEYMKVWYPEINIACNINITNSEYRNKISKNCDYIFNDNYCIDMNKLYI